MSLDDAPNVAFKKMMNMKKIYSLFFISVFIFSSVLFAEDAGDKQIVDKQVNEGEGFTPVISAEQPPAESGGGMSERISLDLRNIEISEALRFLSMKGKLNIALSKSVAGRLFLVLNNVPVGDIFDIILLSNELAYVKQGEIYNIMTETEYKARYGKKFSDARKVKTFQLRYAVPERVFAAVEALKSEVGRVLVDQESGMVLVMETEENLAKIEDVINTLEQKRTVRTFSLQYAKAKDLEERLKPQLDGKGAGSVTSDDRSNQLVVQTFPDRMDEIEKLVKSLDKKTKEVLIVSKIIKVTLSDNFQAEIQLEGLFKNVLLFPFDTENPKGFLGNHGLSPLARTGTSFLDDFISITPTTRPTQGSRNTLTENLVFGQKGPNDNFEILLNYLRTIGDTRVLSNPRITVVNNQEAKIHVGERQAYVTTTTTTGSSTTSTAEAVTFVDVGIELSVTPTINDDGFVTMKIKPAISSVTSTLTTTSGNKIPIIDTSEAESTVMVKDQTTIVIAGLRKDELVDTDKRVPYISDVPLFGRLFRSGTNKKARTEVIVLLTPTIISGEKFITGEPDVPQNAIKGFRDYSPLALKPEKKPASANGISGFFKRVPFISHE